MTHSFRDLHARGNPFVLANVWDKGTACLLAGLGAQALATSSGAHAFTLGRAHFFGHGDGHRDPYDLAQLINCDVRAGRFFGTCQQPVLRND